MQRTYLAIDLKKLLRECGMRRSTPRPTYPQIWSWRIPPELKTICLAVSPSLKAYGIPRG